MKLADIDQVFMIEVASYAHPWPMSYFIDEITKNSYARYIVAEIGGQIVGYCGMWLMAGEAHISTIAVRPEWRRRGIGELLLVAMLEQAVELGADLATLEVRVSNIAAQSLYQKYGFAKVGLRPHYYSDRGEDALVMSTRHLTSVAFQSGFQRLKAELRQKLMERFPAWPE